MMEDLNDSCKLQQEVKINFATKVVHAGQSPADQQSPFKDVVPPISLSTTFKQLAPNEHAGFKYSLCGNPIKKVLQDCVASLDGGKHCLTFSSGLGATTALMYLLKTGDHILCGDDVYGGTANIFKNFVNQFGVKLTMTDFTNEQIVEKMILPETKLIWLESPTNPLMRISNLETISKIAHNIRNDIVVVIDNTFQTPYFQKPLDLGVDVVLYSLTKYLNGHSDVIMGALVINDTELHDRLAYIQCSYGIGSSPFDCYLVNRGLKTLHLRMKEHMKNGLAVARFLEQHRLVEKVLHPGLPSHPQHRMAVRQCSGFGGMLSFYIKGGLLEAIRFLKALRVFCVAVSLGGTESLAYHPALMSHADVPLEERLALNITDNLIRLSVGLESEDDIIADLDQALQASIIGNN
ncbi:Pyridoxal phosphate-dependent transferase, subdomain 2,Pyridoxal phosphate-dependent transferase [Cinara cedri]|uniref:cystathionine gamma-lyase n=1 Tax=Cinara cedri TaxID=506608 RepID=A0A5E4MS18_9HEMI|nr:Pyridoxal phosphate-dependent transferase, subdomain 2,Pyridoxal phosphate-dependent transferase [Cinara cedri]